MCNQIDQISIELITADHKRKRCTDESQPVCRVRGTLSPNYSPQRHRDTEKTNWDMALRRISDFQRMRIVYFTYLSLLCVSVPLWLKSSALNNPG